ncbi:hypothetical protein TruAng_001954 [Truncatella angustata]|nr:hypothetical protein TruAng_001954 [Truncatella angustata]
MNMIDVHHHFLPPAYAHAWQESGQIPSGLVLPSWSVDEDLSFLDRQGIRTAILSLSAPGVSIAGSPERAKNLARDCNNYAAEIHRTHPDRFGFFATLPLENMNDCFEELLYALDELGADGVTLFTSYAGLYLGHEYFKPLWEELNRRAAVVFIHPVSVINPGPPHNLAVPPPIIDFPHETTRAAVHLITSNTIRDNPNCKIILSHGGGTLPYVATRIANATADVGLISKTAEEFLTEAKSFYFDLALTSYEDPIRLLSNFATHGHILWGSDFPFAREKTVQGQLDVLNNVTLEPNFRQSIIESAALKLFPRLLNSLR